MFRRLSILMFGAAILFLATGCRGLVNRTPGLVAAGVAGSGGGAAPCQLTGNAMPREQCFDAITGMPIPCPPQGSTMVIPGGAYPSNPGMTPTAPSNELPFPGPSDMIPRPSVPFAPPSVAPGGDGLGTSKGGQSGKTGSNK